MVEEIASSDFLNENSKINHTSIYARSKYEGEKYLLSQEISSGKKIIILRPPMIHGSGDKGSLSLLYKFISKGIPYPLLAFNNKRSFISINNFCFL
ncbi:SDR family oxidoreductase [Flavobacterium covae]|nr:SDR family oxidoreductase [Flavobacterium covae]QYS91372.1 SDR family oxidoreductase [Flavobacterium covae]